MKEWLLIELLLDSGPERFSHLHPLIDDGRRAEGTEAEMSFVCVQWKLRAETKGNRRIGWNLVVCAI